MVSLARDSCALPDPFYNAKVRNLEVDVYIKENRNRKKQQSQKMNGQ